MFSAFHILLACYYNIVLNHEKTIDTKIEVL